MIIKILSLCAALFAPESTGLDPHGRSLHLKLYADFNATYGACITTANQAQKYGIDPFVAISLAYETTGMSMDRAGKSPFYKTILNKFGCDRHGQFTKSSCSSFMIAPARLADLLKEKSDGDYSDAVCRFLSTDDKCRRKNKNKIERIKNMSRRFADCYSRTHTYFTWRDPFQREPERSPRHLRQHRRQHAAGADQRGFPNTRDLELNDLLFRLRNGMAYNNYNLKQKMNYGINLIISLIGPTAKVEARSPDNRTVKFFLHIDHRDLRDRLWRVANQTSGYHKAFKLQETEQGQFKLYTPEYILTFSPHGNIFIINIQDAR